MLPSLICLVNLMTLMFYARRKYHKDYASGEKNSLARPIYSISAATADVVLAVEENTRRMATANKTCVSGKN